MEKYRFFLQNAKKYNTIKMMFLIAQKDEEEKKKIIITILFAKVDNSLSDMTKKDRPNIQFV